jgi:hypothetical protein
VKPITQEVPDLSNYKKGVYLKPFKNQRASLTGNDADFTSTTGDRLGLQPQIHKRFLSMSNGVHTMIPKTTTNSFSAERGALDLSLNSIELNRVVRQKQNIESSWTKPTNPNFIQTATLVDPNDF